MEELSLTELWASLPKLVRFSFGDDAGEAPRPEALVHFFADEADLRQGLQMLDAATPDVVHIFLLIQQRAAIMAERVQKRRALLFPEQRVATTKLHRIDEQTATNYRWLLQASGAVRTMPRLQCRVNKPLLSRAAQEQSELEKWHWRAAQATSSGSAAGNDRRDEVTVCDASLSLSLRGFAFYKLLKLWAAARHSDFESLNRASLILIPQGLEGRLDRTKTSGPGRRVRFLPIFISRVAYLTCPKCTWLEVGFEIWSSAGMNFERDYFSPLPSADWKECKQAMAS
eukprot:s1590_g4.t1